MFQLKAYGSKIIFKCLIKMALSLTSSERFHVLVEAAINHWSTGIWISIRKPKFWSKIVKIVAPSFLYPL